MIKKVRNKFFRILYKFAMLNWQRVLLLRLMGAKIGVNVYIGDGLYLNCSLGHESNLNIESGVALATNVNLVIESYPNFSQLRYYVSLNPFLKSIGKKLVIKKDAWLGAGSIILPGITIGEGAVIGAGSVVTKDVEDFSVVAGIPAREIKKVIK